METEKRVTISTHNGSSYCREHNKRNPLVVAREDHIRIDGSFEIWKDESPKEAYKRIFGKALDEYNAKQTREDRKIRSYYKKICDDEKKHPVYEMIVGIYGKDEQGKLSFRKVQTFISSLGKQGVNKKTGGSLSVKTQKHYLSFISDVMLYAKRCGYIDSNPCKDITFYQV